MITMCVVYDTLLHIVHCQQTDPYAIFIPQQATLPLFAVPYSGGVGKAFTNVFCIQIPKDKAEKIKNKDQLSRPISLRSTRQST
jgi:hypothetical protein